MKSFEQIAKAMFEAHELSSNEIDGIPVRSWIKLRDNYKKPWIEAAKEAYKQITEVH